MILHCREKLLGRDTSPVPKPTQVGGLAPGIAHGLAEAFGWLNLILALFNLLPGLPLDGGQLVESLVWRLTGDRHRGRVVAGYCGIAVTLLVVFWFVGRPFLRGDQPNFAAFGWTLLICFFLWQGARSAITAVGCASS